MTNYEVEKEGYSDTRYLVTRRNSIGQGWSVTAYGSKETADKVAAFLNQFVDEEA